MFHTYPTTNGGMQMEAHLESIHIAYTFGSDSYVQSMLINKIYALELSRTFIKGTLLVG